MSTINDVNTFIDFISKCFIDSEPTDTTRTLPNSKHVPLLITAPPVQHQSLNNGTIVRVGSNVSVTNPIIGMYIHVNDILICSVLFIVAVSNYISVLYIE